MEKRIISTAKINNFERKLYYEEKSTATIEKYIRDIHKFAAFAAGNIITKELVIKYKQNLLQNYAPTSVNSMLAAINKFFKENEWYECIVKTIKIQRQAFRMKDKELSKEEYYCLLETAYNNKDYRLYLLMQTICSTGIRVSELKFITVESIKRGRATVYLKGKTREVLIPISLCRELKKYAKEKNISSGSVFITRDGNPMDRSNILHKMKALCKQAGVDRRKVFPHNLRHLFACQYYKISKDISHLADLLGHSSINTTRIYTSTSGEEQQRQIERLGLII